MKGISIYTISLLVLISLFFAQCRTGSFNDKKDKFALHDTIGEAVITFSNVEHDFGKINEGENVACIFKFSNTGDADLVLTSVLTSCGCTVSKYDKKPIPPGGSGTINISYDSSDRSGRQTKTITVQSNARNKIMILRITAEVINNNK
jgi:hypothetical protein